MLHQHIVFQMGQWLTADWSSAGALDLASSTSEPAQPSMTWNSYGSAVTGLDMDDPHVGVIIATKVPTGPTDDATDAEPWYSGAGGINDTEYRRQDGVTWSWGSFSDSTSGNGAILSNSSTVQFDGSGGTGAGTEWTGGVGGWALFGDPSPGTPPAYSALSYWKVFTAFTGGTVTVNEDSILRFGTGVLQILFGSDLEDAD